MTARKADNLLEKRLAEAKEAADKWPEWKREAMKAQVTIGPALPSELPRNEPKRTTADGPTALARDRAATGEVEPQRKRD